VIKVLAICLRDLQEVHAHDVFWIDNAGVHIRYLDDLKKGVPFNSQIQAQCLDSILPYSYSRLQR